MAVGLLAVLAPVSAPDAVAANPTITSFSLSGSPFAESFAPLPQQATLNLVLARRARVTVTIRRPDGTRVRRLARSVRLAPGTYTWTWSGTNSTGGPLPDGRYTARVVATNSRGTAKAERPLRKGLPQIYPVNPGALVICVDPGHGGRFPGATRDGFMEKDFNLDIGLQLEALLERAGVQVVMTRTSDAAAQEPAADLNGDGKIDRYDDDLTRNDVANVVRADVGVHVHNNAATNTSARGTEAFYNAHRSFAADGLELATAVLAGEVESLAAYHSAQFDPVDAGVHTGWYYYLGPYDPPYLPRPSLMTSVLSESLFVSNASELEALKRPDVRLSIAAGIYLGLAEWLNTRDFGVGYALTSAAPSAAAAGGDVTYHLRVTNRGNQPSQGWTLQLGAVAAVPLYDGSGAHGSPVGSIPVPDGMAPGQSVDLEVHGLAPAEAGDWLVKADIRLPDDSYLSEVGIVPLQVPLTATIAP